MLTYLAGGRAAILAFWLPRLWQLPLRTLAKVKHRFAVRRASCQLQELPDFILKDIGISRCDIDYVTAHGGPAVRSVVGRGAGGSPKRGRRRKPRRALNLSGSCSCGRRSDRFELAEPDRDELAGLEVT
jgi:uncharacterized protein YjiS (DUF1127 family)